MSFGSANETTILAKIRPIKKRDRQLNTHHRKTGSKFEDSLLSTFKLAVSC